MSKRKRKDNPESKSTYLKEIEELDKEVNRLENELEIKERSSAESFSDELLARVISELKEGHSSSRNSRKRSSSEEQELNCLLSRIEKLASLTGLVFEEDKVKLISSFDENNNSGRYKLTCTKRWRRILSGKCFSLPFLIELETEEILEEEPETENKDLEDQERITLRITELSIEVKCPLATKELKTFIEAAEQEKSIATTLIVLEQYAKWNDFRWKTFKHFKSKYPDLICVFDTPDKSETIELKNKLYNGLCFNIQWSIDTSNDGCVLPQINAFVSCPSEVCGPELEPVLTSTPEQFRKMLSRFGIEKAIEFIISIVQQ